MLPPETFAERLGLVRDRMASAAARAGRRVEDITLVAVTKVFPVAAIELGYRHGLRDFGENYVQEFEEKAPQVARMVDARFHLIGHLQSNKARKAAEIFQVIETVDSAKLARRLDEAAKPMQVMIEVKLSSEEAKHGCPPGELAAVIEAVRQTKHLELRGLMTIPPWSEDPEVTRPYFSRLRELAREQKLEQLSMGMSHDFEAAIEEGATIIRVGTALFGSRRKTMRVGFHSPLPPARSGVADYAASLLVELRKHGEVEVGAREADVHLYHLGNNRLHERTYHESLEKPGVCVLHDAVLHHFYLGTLTREQYIEEFAGQYGEWHRSFAARLWDERAVSAIDHRYFDYPMLRKAAGNARAVIVHNAAAARMVAEDAAHVPVIEIPHFVERVPPPHTAAIYEFRRKLGIADLDYVFGVFGYLRESKRVLPVIETFLGVAGDHPHAVLMLAGEFLSGDLRRAVEHYLQHTGIYHIGHLPSQEFWTAACAADAVINLRDPAAGETSGIAIRAMGLGKPVILSDGLETAGFPAGSCLRVTRGVAEQAELSEYMKLAVEMPNVMREIGEVAKQHVTTEHSLEQAGRKYWEVLCAYRG